MDSLKEIYWLSKIYNSKARKKIFGTIPLCKKDFERVAEAPESSKEFSEWFDKLVMEGVFLFAGKINGKNYITNGYIFTDQSIESYIKNNDELYETYLALEGFINRYIV